MRIAKQSFAVLIGAFGGLLLGFYLAGYIANTGLSLGGLTEDGRRARNEASFEALKRGTASASLDARESKLKEVIDGLDEHSAYFDRESFANFQRTSRQQYSGIGVRLVQEGHGVVISQIFPNSPAEQAGLMPGDILMQMGDRNLHQTGVSEVASLIRSSQGEDIALEIFRPETGLRERMQIRTEWVALPTIHDLGMLRPGIAYMRISRFGAKTPEEFSRALDEVDTLVPASLLIDLRGNPGGLLQSALEMIDELLPADQVMLNTQMPDQIHGQVFLSQLEERPHDYTIYILQDRYTASAAEIFSGALSSHEKVLMLGEHTRGKGSIQSVRLLPNGEGVKYTSATYYLPDGTYSGGSGLIPDIPLDFDLGLESERDYYLDQHDRTESSIEVWNNYVTARRWNLVLDQALSVIQRFSRSMRGS